ncbi:MAG: PhoD-like phosphatase N-terminal domain-containing protein [Cyanobacteriota bacterium]
MSASSIRFAHGVASGDPSADSGILWTRISPPEGFVGSQTVQWELASSADFSLGSIKASGSFTLSTSPEARPLINWQPGWQELDLIFGLSFDAMGVATPLDPAAYASVPRDGVRLADVRVIASAGADKLVVGAGSTVEAGPGSDELDNTDSLGGNVLVGGVGTDRFVLRAAADSVL